MMLKGFVYIMRDAGYPTHFKIGASRNVSKRLWWLKKGGYNVEVMWSESFVFPLLWEALLHWWFGHRRIVWLNKNGIKGSGFTEWFDMKWSRPNGILNKITEREAHDRLKFALSVCVFCEGALFATAASLATYFTIEYLFYA